MKFNFPPHPYPMEKFRIGARTASTALVFVLAASCAAPTASSPEPILASTGGAPTVPPSSSPLEYATALAFSPDGTLFVGDSGTGKVYALKLPEAENPAAQAGYNLKDVDAQLAALLGTTPRHVRVRDMAVHPKTKEVYLAVGRVTGDSYASALAVVNQAGTPRLVEMDPSVRSVKIPFAPAEGFEFYDEVPARDLSITDIKYHDGQLYVAGLSNADFASSLWVVPVPFDGKARTTTIEIYHAIHGQKETRAPIRAMAIKELNGEPHLVAAYTCTPLVVFPLSALKEGAHVVGKTIGELGYGNTPVDLISFTGSDAKQQPLEVLFISHKNQSAQVIGVAAVEAAARGDGLTQPVMLQKVDLGASNPPMTSLMHIDEQDAYHLLAVRRDVSEGDIEIVSYLKNVYFRLSDFQSEYEIPGYTFTPEQKMTREFQNKMKLDEGKASFVVE